MPPANRTLVAAGTGNNGGDGLAIGRLLSQAGFPVDFVLLGKEEKCSAETAAQLKILENYGYRVMRKLPEREYDIIIDSIFGIGLTRPVEGGFAEAVGYINAQDAYVLSVDIPSGIHGDTGEVMGCAVQADVTVTYRASGASLKEWIFTKQFHVSKVSNADTKQHPARISFHLL